MIEDFRNFLKGHNLINAPLLLGLSGGPDSTALFHLLLLCNHSFEVAHLDHGWREESRQEAEEIQQLCRSNSIRCHIKNLQVSGSNLEDKSRQMRHQFFHQVCKENNLKGVLLGHHADDQAETVLKRVFEGASLQKLAGLWPKATLAQSGLTLYRPLLKIRKQIILNWLETNHIPYFVDRTNEDSKYLRGRMRTTLLPLLSKNFGKNVESSLCRLGESAQELQEFLEGILSEIRKQVIESEEEISLDFCPFLSQPNFIVKAAIRDLFEKGRLALPSSSLVAILTHLQKNHAHKILQISGKKVKVHRGVLIIKKLK